MKNHHLQAVIDVETTGLFPGYGDRVVEVAAVLVDEGQIVSEFSSLIRVTKAIPATYP